MKLKACLILLLSSALLISCGYAVPRELAEYIERLNIERAQSNVATLDIHYESKETHDIKGKATNKLVYKATNSEDIPSLYYYLKRETTGYLIPNTFPNATYEIEVTYNTSLNDGTFIKVEDGVTENISASDARLFIRRLFYVDGINDAAGEFYVEGGFYYGDYIARYLKYNQFMTMDDDNLGLTYATGNVALSKDPSTNPGYYNSTYHLDDFGMLTDYEGLAVRYENNFRGEIMVKGIYTYHNK